MHIYFWAYCNFFIFIQNRNCFLSQSLIGILLIVSVAIRVKDYMDEKPDAYAIEAVYDLEIKARSNMDKRFNKKMRQETENFHQEPTLREFRFSDPNIVIFKNCYESHNYDRKFTPIVNSINQIPGYLVCLC